MFKIPSGFRTNPGMPPAVFVALALLALGCSSKPEVRQREIAHASRNGVGLRAELKPNAAVVATLDLGERVVVMERRRRFVKVRTMDGIEGWTRDTRLATPELREMIRQLRQQTETDSSQGIYHALYTLNVHLKPYRWSHTIYQLTEDEPVDLLRHRLVDRIPRQPEPGKPSPAPTGLDDWTLVRLSDGQAGWVLATGLYSAIPDEVKQFAERRRITSYARLGVVEDPRQPEPKVTWLWTQLSRGKQSHDFDLVRVFRWNRRRRAYRTIKLERGLTGYLPVKIHRSLKTPRGAGPGFTITVATDGKLVERTYVLLETRVRRIGEEAAGARPVPVRLVKPKPPPQPPPSLLDRLLHWGRPDR